MENRHILLIEDDVDLAVELRDVFTERKARVTIVDHMNEAQHALQNSGPFDLVVLDIMLPVTKEEVTRVRELDRELADLRKTLRKEDKLRESDHSLKLELEKAYERRAAILAERDTLIDPEAGLMLLKSLADSESIVTPRPPVLVLTAVGNKQATTTGMNLLGNRGDWLVKPVTPDCIVDAATRLIRST